VRVKAPDPRPRETRAPGAVASTAPAPDRTAPDRPPQTPDNWVARVGSSHAAPRPLPQTPAPDTARATPFRVTKEPSPTVAFADAPPVLPAWARIDPDLKAALIARNHASAEDLAEHEARALLCGEPVVERLLGREGFSDSVLADAMAGALGLRVLHLADLTGDCHGLDVGRVEPYARQGALTTALLPLMPPMPRKGGPAYVVGASFANYQRLKTMLADPASAPLRETLALAAPSAMTDALLHLAGNRFAAEAANGLSRKRPWASARFGLINWQKLSLSVAGAGFAALAFTFGLWVLVLVDVALAGFFFAHTLLRSYAALLNRRSTSPAGVVQARWPSLGDDDLPPYTVLIPLYKEAGMLPHIATMLGTLDYPAAKLDVKLLVEACDSTTREAVLKTRLPAFVTVLPVPDLGPRTKPKALNAALPFATGTLVTVFDAEDWPAPDQLRRAAAAFHHGPAEVDVWQARLAYYNGSQNWIARQFELEYAVHFSFLLPALQALDLPIPLGGTSNHFRVAQLREIGGWDAYNVTEDADLGIRFCRFGSHIAMLDTETSEEAAAHPVSWLKQRTRWLKGWMQTYAVHMRHPVMLWKSLGARGFLGFQVMIGGLIISPLAHLCFTVTAAVYVLYGGLFNDWSSPFAVALVCVNIFNCVCGYGAAGLLTCRAARARGTRPWLSDILLLPVYWWMAGLAAHRALWQLIRQPFLWEKTPHGDAAHPAKRVNAIA